MTFLSRLHVTKYSLSGLQSHDQMIRLCTAVSFLVCAWSENCSSAGERTHARIKSQLVTLTSARQHHTFGHILLKAPHVGVLTGELVVKLLYVMIAVV